jgi:hypothetical protein
MDCLVEPVEQPSRRMEENDKTFAKDRILEAENGSSELTTMYPFSSENGAQEIVPYPH